MRLTYGDFRFVCMIFDYLRAKLHDDMEEYGLSLETRLSTRGEAQ